MNEKNIYVLTENEYKYCYQSEVELLKDVINDLISYYNTEYTIASEIPVEEIYTKFSKDIYNLINNHSVNENLFYNSYPWIDKYKGEENE